MTKEEKINMDIKDIAKEIRAKLKKELPLCNFSVSIERFSGGQSLDIALMSAPFEAFSKMVNHVGDPITKQYAQLNKHRLMDQPDNDYLCNGVYLTPEAWFACRKAVLIANYYNYDESDLQSDYFNVNFYLDINIGKWDKPFIREVKR